MARIDFPRPVLTDAVAGASVALVLIPQSLAYARLAGLPPHIGLFAAALPLIAFSLLASSPFLQTGPTAVISLLTFAALPDVEPAELPRLATLLALMVGTFRFVLGLARLGIVVRLIALPVVTGFTSGAAILILASQVPRSLGLESDDDGVLGEAWSALTSPTDWRWDALVLSAITIALFLGSRRVHPLFPGVLVAVIIGIVWERTIDYSGPTVESVPEGLPPFSADLPWGEIPTLAVGALVIALVGFAEPVSIARTFANETGQRWDANREFMASGVANAVSAMSGGYPVGGSFSRSSINKMAGATTRWSGGVTGLIVLAFLPFASVLEPLPRSVLGAIVFGAALTLVKPRLLMRLWHRNREQALLAWTVFGATLVTAPRVERAVLLGVALTVVLHLWKRLVIDRVDGDGEVTLVPRGLFWLGTDATFAATLDEAADGSADVVIDFANCPFVDDPAIQAMRNASRRLRSSGHRLRWCNEPEGTQRMLAAVDIGAGVAAPDAETA